MNEEAYDYNNIIEETKNKVEDLDKEVDNREELDSSKYAEQIKGIDNSIKDLETQIQRIADKEKEKEFLDKLKILKDLFADFLEDGNIDIPRESRFLNAKTKDSNVNQMVENAVSSFLNNSNTPHSLENMQLALWNEWKNQLILWEENENLEKIWMERGTLSINWEEFNWFKYSENNMDRFFVYLNNWMEGVKFYEIPAPSWLTISEIYKPQEWADKYNPQGSITKYEAKKWVSLSTKIGKNNTLSWSVEYQKIWEIMPYITWKTKVNNKLSASVKWSLWTLNQKGFDLSKYYVTPEIFYTFLKGKIWKLTASIGTKMNEKFFAWDALSQSYLKVAADVKVCKNFNVKGFVKAYWTNKFTTWLSGIRNF